MKTLVRNGVDTYMYVQNTTVEALRYDLFYLKMLIIALLTLDFHGGEKSRTIWNIIFFLVVLSWTLCFTLNMSRYIDW